MTSPRPFLLTGPSGTGKTTAIRTYIAEQNCLDHFHPFATNTDIEAPCGCLHCSKLRQGKTVDVLTLTGQMKVDEIRKGLAAFLDHAPVELKSRYLILRDAHFHTKETLDQLLKTLEEPPEYLEVFVTAANAEWLPNAIKSRCDRQVHPWLPENFIPRLVKLAPVLSAHTRAVGKFPFRSTRQLTTYSRLDLEKKFNIFFKDPASAFSIETQARQLFEDLATDPDYAAEEARLFALHFFDQRVRWHISANVDTMPGLGTFEGLYIEGIEMWSRDGILNLVSSPRAGQYINLENQWVGLLQAVFIARKIADLA